MDRFIVAKKEVDRSFSIAEIRFPSGVTDVAIKCNSNRCNCNIVGGQLLLLLLLLLAVVFLGAAVCQCSGFMSSTPKSEVNSVQF